MTEAEWQVCESPYPMLAFLEGPDTGNTEELRLYAGGATLYGRQSDRFSPRKFRLFSAACARRLWRLTTHRPSQAFIELFDRYANDEVDRQALQAACREIGEASHRGEECAVDQWASAMWSDDPIGAARCAIDVSWMTAWIVTKDSVAVTRSTATEEDQWLWGWTGPPDPRWQAARASEERLQSQLLRDIIGNPF